MSRGVVSAMISDQNTVGVSSAVVKKEKEETKSKRVNFLVRPSIYEKVRAKCDETGVSMNDAVNQLLEKWVQE